MKILNWEISPEKLCLISNPPPCISWSWPRIRIPCTEDIYYIWQVRTWRNGLFFWNSNFLILVSFHPSYFKLWVLLDQIVKVCPNKSFHQQGAKIKGFENQSSRRLNSFLIFSLFVFVVQLDLVLLCELGTRGLCRAKINPGRKNRTLIEQFYFKITYIFD